MIGELAAVKSDVNVPSLWSVGVETMDRDYARFPEFRQFVGETGVGYGRLQSGWAKTETQNRPSVSSNRHLIGPIPKVPLQITQAVLIQKI